MSAVLGDDPEVVASAFTPDGTLVVVGTHVTVWNVESRQKLSQVPAPPGRRLTVISPDGLRVAVIRTGEPVLVLATSTGEVLQTLPLESGNLLFLPNGQLAANVRPQFCLWEEGAWRETPITLGTHTPAVSPDGNFLVGTPLIPVYRPTQVYDLRDYSASATLEGALSHTIFAWSADGRLIAGVGLGPVQVWEASTGKFVWSSQEPRRAETLAFSPDGQWLAVGDRRGELFVLNAATAVVRRRFTQPALSGGTLSFSPSGRWLARSAALYSVDEF